MFANGSGDGVNDKLRDRARAGFRAPEADDATRERVLTDARGRAAETARPAFSRGMMVRAGAVLLGAAVLFAALFLQTTRSPVGVPMQKASAAVVLSRAKAAVSDSSTVLHVVASTGTTQLPLPQQRLMTREEIDGAMSFGGLPSIEGVALPEGEPTSASSVPRGPDKPSNPTTELVLFPELESNRIDTEHWIDRTHALRRSTRTELITVPSGIWYRYQTDRLVNGDHERTMRASSSTYEIGNASPSITERLVSDEEWAIPMIETDGPFTEPSQQLHDTSDPTIYYELLNGRTLNAPHYPDSKPMVTHTRASLLEQSSIGGVPVYRLQIVSSSYYPWNAKSGVDTTLVASIRCSDYLPLRAEGVQHDFEIDSHGRRAETPAGRVWTTRYLTMESLPQSRVPAHAFRLQLPAGSIAHSSVPLSASKVASSVPFPVFWLSKRYEGLRFVGSYRRTENEVEYSGRVNVDSAMMEADHNRPKISGLQVGAEYSPSGKPANRDKRATTPGIKVVSMPRTDPTKWEKSMQYTLGSLNGSPSTSPTLRWTTVGGRRALHLRREWLWGRGENAPPGQVKWTCDYLVIDYGNATVMLQAVFLKRGEVERAARALRVVQ